MGGFQQSSIGAGRKAMRSLRFSVVVSKVQWAPALPRLLATLQSGHVRAVAVTESHGRAEIQCWLKFDPVFQLFAAVVHRLPVPLPGRHQGKLEWGTHARCSWQRGACAGATEEAFQNSDAATGIRSPSR